MGVSKAGLLDRAPSPMGKMAMRDVHTVNIDPVVREMHRVLWKRKPGGRGGRSG